MKQIIAVPTNNNHLSQHFGHCEKFAIFEIAENKIERETYLTPPPHQPGVLPQWLASKGVTHVITGGIGQRAVSLFNSQNITVISGAEEKNAERLVNEFIYNRLKTGVNSCDH